MAAAEIELPDWAEQLWTECYSYAVLYGGRGSAKSWTVAAYLILETASKPLRVGCFRELQRSIRDSSHKLLSDTIHRLGLAHLFHITDTRITSLAGAEFVFYGLRHNITEIKSMEGIDIAWVEEAQAVSEYSWEVLDPTIRGEESKVFVTFNPDLEEDPTYQMFIENPPPETLTIYVNWPDNPFITNRLLKLKDHKYRVDPDAAEWIWGGKCRKNSEAQILAGKCRVDILQPDPDSKDWHGPYHGADWGFSQDPTALVRLWLHEPHGGPNILYVEREAGGIGVELDDIEQLFTEAVPDIHEHEILADNARPEVINHVRKADQFRKPQPRRGLRVKAAKKWEGSIKDGIEHLRNYDEIVIHPTCSETIAESRLYSYKVDQKTGTVLSSVKDEHNHYMDAIRYALSKIIRKAGTAGTW